MSLNPQASNPVNQQAAQDPYLSGSSGGQSFSGSSLNSGVAESQARQLISQSLTSFGAMPNPQAVYSAINTGTTPQVQQAMQDGNPLLQTMLASEPAGSTASQAAVSLPKAVNPGQDLYNFNWNQYWQKDNSDQLHQDKNQGWRDFGMVPQLNFGWMDGVLNKSSPDDIKKWQSYFKKMDSKVQVTGLWDDTSKGDFNAMMQSLAMPVALYSQDPNQRQNASMFLQLMGQDMPTLQNKVRDPSSQQQMVQMWMMWQGPNSETGNKAQLQNYAEQFGKENLPATYQQIEDPNFLDQLRSTVSGFPILGLLNDVPVVGGAFHALTNVATGNIDTNHPGDIFQDPRQLREQQINSKLSASDKEMLAPALQQVKSDAGWLGFFDSYDSARTKGLLQMSYFFGDGLGEGKWQNPFDPMSAANLGAEAHKDDLFRGLFGDQAANMPLLPGLVNFSANVLDDPISYLPLVGQLQIAKDLKGARTLVNVLGKDAKFQPIFNDMRRNLLNTSQREFVYNARAMQKSGVGNGMTTFLRMMNFHGGPEDTRAAVQALDKVLDPNTDFEKAMETFQNGDSSLGIDPMGHHLPTARGLYNLHASMKNLALINSSTRWAKIRAVGALTDEPLQGLMSDPISVANHLEKMSIAVGMDYGQMSKPLDDLIRVATTDPNKAVSAYNAALDTVLGAFEEKIKAQGGTMQDFTKYVGRLRNGKTLKRTASEDVGNADMFFPDPRAVTPDQAKELSLAPNWLDNNPDLRRAALNHYINLKNDLQIMQRTGAEPEDIKQAQEQIDNFAQSAMRPGPALTTQLADEVRIPYSLHEMVSYLNPAMRKMDTVQSAGHVDFATNVWKRFTIGKISSALRMDLGEDVIRTSAQLLAAGHTREAVANIGQSMLMAAGVLIPGAHGKVLDWVNNNVEKMLESNQDIRPMLQNAAKTLQTGDPNFFQPFLPSSMGYKDALVKAIHNHFHPDPIVQAWVGNGKKGLRDLFKDPDPKTKAVLEEHGATLSPEYMKMTVNQYDDMLSGLLRDKEVRQWVKTGNINQRQLDRKLRSASDPTTTLPAIMGRKDTKLSNYFLGAPSEDGRISQAISKVPGGEQLVQGTKGVAGAATAFLHPTQVIEKIHVPMINAARINGYKKIKNLWAQHIRDYYSDTPWGQGKDFEKWVDKQSYYQARDWMLTNTYQGTRSVMGSSFRNVLPFWGATANMNKFWMRQSAAAPFVGSTVYHTAVKSQESQNDPGTGGWEGVLSHLGFTGGEGASFNPLHSFFLTSDGIASFVPGTGPWFTPLWQFAAHHDIADFLSGIPGVGQNIDYNTGQARPEIPWLADLISGSYTAATGENFSPPFVGESADQMNLKVSEKIKQRERAGQSVTQDQLPDIRREVGRELMLQGALSYTVPMSPTVGDVGQKNLTNLQDTWRSAPDQNSRDQIIAQQYGMTPDQWKKGLADGSTLQAIQNDPNNPAAVLAYEDSNFGPEQRDVIATVSPWVVSQTQSMYNTPHGDYAPNLTTWQRLRAMGNITVINPSDYINNIAKEKNINSGWIALDGLRNMDLNIRQSNGWTTNNPAYTRWKNSVYEPALMQLMNSNTDWRNVYSTTGRTDLAGLAYSTRALRTLSTFEVLPQDPGSENPTSIAWRNALVARDQAAQQVESIKAARGSQAEVDNVMQGLQVALQGLASQDPNFAAQLSQFQFSKWEDIVNLEAGEMLGSSYV